MNTVKVDVIVPVYRPGREFPELLRRLKKQKYPLNRLIIMNTDKEYWKTEWEKEIPFMEVHHLSRKEFDHGGTRKKAAELSEADILVYMTQDAVPADSRMIGNLIRPLLEDERVGAAYARQLPRRDCGIAERYARSFNYPEVSLVKWERDLPRYGVKTFFCSNVCAAYRRPVYQKLGGFVDRTIFNEDMIYAGKLIHAGWGIAYAADARVIHSHNYSCLQQFRRNFDLGVSQADHPEIFAGISSEGEGVRLVKETLRYLLKKGRLWMIPGFIVQSGFKYAGYLAGKNYKKLPGRIVLRCTMNRSWWEK